MGFLLLSSRRTPKYVFLSRATTLFRSTSETRIALTIMNASSSSWVVWISSTASATSSLGTLGSGSCAPSFSAILRRLLTCSEIYCLMALATICSKAAWILAV